MSDGLVVREFGRIERPRYSATVSRWTSLRAKANGWCCDIGKGHRTPRAAALHAADLALDEWRTQSAHEEEK